MKELFLIRTRTCGQGTFGTLSDENIKLCTAELPWKDNKRMVSCIPPGIYLVKARTSRRYPYLHYHVTKVKGRTGILIHKGNFAGDKSLGYWADSTGCILVGTSYGKLQIQGNHKAQEVVLNSAAAMIELEKYIGRKSFYLRIKESYNG